MTPEELRDEVVRLGPWHIDVEITPEVSTSAFLEARSGDCPDALAGVSFHNTHDTFLRRMRRIFPAGLEGRSMLDCACNCGGYLFYAKEIGAGRCFGFDVREHWIRQARFLAEHRQKPTDEMRFEVCDLYDLPKLAPGRFDVTLFSGLFYHLPEPVSGLKLAADLTDELLLLNTAAWPGQPDGLLVPEQESTTRVMSGVHGLCWLPTGPAVLTRILEWLGFPEVRCSGWRSTRPELDRIEVLAARRPGFFDDWDAGRPPRLKGVCELIETHTNPRATVLVMADDERLAGLLDRDAVGFPADAAGAGDQAAIDELERRRAEGARYLAITPEGLERLERQPGLGEHLERHGHVTLEDPACRIYSLV